MKKSREKKEGISISSLSLSLSLCLSAVSLRQRETAEMIVVIVFLSHAPRRRGRKTDMNRNMMLDAAPLLIRERFHLRSAAYVISAPLGG